MKPLLHMCLLVFLLLPLSSCSNTNMEHEDIITSTPSTDVAEEETPESFVPLTEDEIRAIGISCGQEDGLGYGWDVFHGDRSRWFENTEDQIATEWISGPMSSNGVFYYFDETGETDVKEIAQILVDKMLSTMTEDDPVLRQFTILDYKVKEQEPQSREQAVEAFVDKTIHLAWDMLAERSPSDIEAYFYYWLGVYPGLDQDMWVFTPNFSFSWSGMAGTASFSPDNADEDGLIDVAETISHSAEADFHILVKYGNCYRLQNMECMVTMATP